jgi:hypothetical protein
MERQSALTTAPSPMSGRCPAPRHDDVEPLDRIAEQVIPSLPPAPTGHPERSEGPLPVALPAAGPSFLQFGLVHHLRQLSRSG